jgi:hypothetical protein
MRLGGDPRHERLMIPQAAIDDLLDRVDIVDVASKYVALRGRGRTKIGPCPICSTDSTSKTSTKFVVAPAKSPRNFLCAACGNGGNAIKLVMLAENLSFPAAVERLGGTRAVDPEEAAKRDAARKAEQEKRERISAKFREDERKRLYSIWKGAAAHPLDMVRAYYARRDLILPPDFHVRFLPNAPYFHGEDENKKPRVIYRGPCQIVPVLAPAGKFAGLHFTWLDLSQDKGKAIIFDPETGEILPAKKVRGSKAGGYIHLSGDASICTTQISGEGIETTDALYTSMIRTGRDVSRVLFRPAVDIGNLSGRAIETVAHPTAKTDKGRPQRVPGAVPDMDSPAMFVPEQIDELILLGDGDSDPFTTRLALVRAGRRHARPGRTIRCPMAPAGEDFDSWRRKE